MTEMACVSRGMQHWEAGEALIVSGRGTGTRPPRIRFLLFNVWGIRGVSSLI